VTEPDSSPPPDLTVEQQLGRLTATIDQLQAEFARAEFAITFLLCAAAMLAALVAIQHRQIGKLAADA
jgi:hypothetical protein